MLIYKYGSLVILIHYLTTYLRGIVMKKLALMFLVQLLAIGAIYAQGVQLKFITHNGYGNNLYIDNITVGNRFATDAAVLSINNITADTSYAIGSTPFNVNPSVSVINLGLNNITSSFTVTMTVSPGTYSSTKTVNSLNAGLAAEVIFDPLTITPGQAVNIQVTSNLSGDENPANNTLNQYTLLLPGAIKNVLLEEWTSSTCGPCASNNPTIDAFVNANFDSLVAIKYHVGWPSPGNDPMYLYNPTQSYDRRFYYGVNAVPHVIMDGIINPSYPYSNAPSLPTAYYQAKAIASPLSVSVMDTRISTDSIRADITINIYSPLSAGNYYLRVHAIERKIEYATPPGTNGERIFSDVFRRAFPNSLGTPIPTTVGTYNISITYPMDNAVWVDSMIYTAVFIQNDVTKEVLNSAKARDHLVENVNLAQIPVNTEREKEFAPDFIQGVLPGKLGTFDSFAVTFQYQLFESDFPPAGWVVKNPDNGITFQKYTGVNGPSLGGNNSVKMDFYSYSASGQKDTLISPLYFGLLETDSVKFDFAYAQYSTTYIDSLIVLLSIDGGQTFPFTVFRKGGSSLATAPITTSAFIPNTSQWQTHTFSLSGVVPVELTSFTANKIQGGVLLEWTTASEVNNLGFEIERSVEYSPFITVGFIDGKGTTTEQQKYSYFDKVDYNGNQSTNYRLKQVDFDGHTSYSDIVEVKFDIPVEFILHQNYPNPFNPSTKITFALPVEEFVTLKIYDMLGKEVASLINEKKAAGTYETNFNATGLASGVYIYKLSAGSYTSTMKMTILR
jgi:hypothetical protein